MRFEGTCNKNFLNVWVCLENHEKEDQQEENLEGKLDLQRIWMLASFFSLPDFVGFRAFVLFRFGSVCFCIVVNLGRGLSFLLVFLLWFLQLVFLGVFSFQWNLFKLFGGIVVKFVGRRSTMLFLCFSCGFWSFFVFLYVVFLLHCCEPWKKQINAFLDFFQCLWHYCELGKRRPSFHVKEIELANFFSLVFQLVFLGAFCIAVNLGRRLSFHIEEIELVI